MFWVFFFYFCCMLLPFPSPDSLAIFPIWQTHEFEKWNLCKGEKKLEQKLYPILKTCFSSPLPFPPFYLYSF